MGIVSGIVVYIMIWWTIIFCVLPIGLSNQYEEQGEIAAPGSPSKLNMKKKILLTSVISAFLWCIVYLIIRSDIISFRSMANH